MLQHPPIEPVGVLLYIERLADGNVLEKLVELKKADRSLFDKIREFFDKLAGKIRQVYKDLKPDSREGQAVQQMKGQVERIQQLFAEALADAGENFQAAEEQKNTTPEGGAQYQIRQIGNSGKYYVQADRQVLSGTDPEMWGKQIESYINEEIRKNEDIAFPTQDGHLLLLTGRSAYKLKDRHVAAIKKKAEAFLSDADYQIKGHAATHIDELIQVARFKKYEPDRDQKHRNDLGEDGFNYFVAHFRDFDGKYYIIHFSAGVNAQEETVYSIGNIRQRSFPADKGSSSGKEALNDGRKASGDIIYTSADKSQEKSTFALAYEAASRSKQKQERSTGASDETASGSKRQFSDRYPSSQITERDREYLDAVNRGDMKAAQRMVDEAAKRWGAFLNNPEANEVFGQSGEVRTFYHGTNTGEFTVFDKDLLGNSSGDLGWFGKGFYFAFSAEEARTYGSRVVNAYLKMRNPYDYSQLYKFKGSDRGSAQYSRFAWLYNIVKQFPDIVSGQKVYAYPNDTENGKAVSWKQVANWMDRIEREANFSVAQVELSNGETAWELRANPKQESFTNTDGETFTWTEYGMRQMFATEMDAKEPINQIGAYLVNVMGVEPVSRRAIEKIDFSGAVQKAGYDGILQSPSGDEAVVFDPSQIKLSDSVTYDDNGKIIPPSQRFDSQKKDIRYSDRKKTGNKKAAAVKAAVDTVANEMLAAQRVDGRQFSDRKETSDVNVQPKPADIQAKDVVVYGDNTVAVRINGSQSGLHKYKKSQWAAVISKQIRDTLQGHAIYAADGDIIRITKRAAGEVSYGSNSKELREEANETGDFSKINQKMITAEHAASIISLSTYNSWSANTEDLRDMFKKDGMNARTVNLLIDGIPHVATVVTGLNADPNQVNDYGEKFYDIVNIEKQTNQSAYNGTFKKKATPHTIKFADDSPDMLTVAQKQRIVNRKNATYTSGDISGKTAFAEAFERASTKQNQDRTTGTSNRALLAGAFEELVTSPDELQFLREYQENVGLLNEQERKLQDIRTEIREISFGKGERDTKKLRQLQDEAIKTANRIDVYDKKLLKLERAKPLRDVLERDSALLAPLTGGNAEIIIIVTGIVYCLVFSGESGQAFCA